MSVSTKPTRNIFQRLISEYQPLLKQGARQDKIKTAKLATCSNGNQTRVSDKKTCQYLKSQQETFSRDSKVQSLLKQDVQAKTMLKQLNSPPVQQEIIPKNEELVEPKNVT